MARDRVKNRIDELKRLLGEPASDRLRDEARKGLRDKSSLVVTTALRLVAEAPLAELKAELPPLFDRLLVDPVKRDPGCAAKLKCVQALTGFGWDDPGVFLKGASHVQMEPVWGGQKDAAAALRGESLAALFTMGYRDALLHAARLLFDPEVETRTLAARATGMVATDASEVLLRAKVHAGDAAPEVLGECFAALLGMESERSLDLVASFLTADDPDLAQEAALAVGQSRAEGAFARLRDAWGRTRPWSRSRLLLPMALVRSADAVEFLVELIGPDDAGLAENVVEALRSTVGGDEAVWSRVEQAVCDAGHPQLIESR